MRKELSPPTPAVQPVPRASPPAVSARTAGPPLAPHVQAALHAAQARFQPGSPNETRAAPHVQKALAATAQPKAGALPMAPRAPAGAGSPATAAPAVYWPHASKGCAPVQPRLAPLPQPAVPPGRPAPPPAPVPISRVVHHRPTAATVQRRLLVQVDADETGALWQEMSRQILNELYRLGSAERRDLVFRPISATVAEVTEPDPPNDSWSASLLRGIIQDRRTTTLSTGAGRTEATLRDSYAHEAGRDSDTQVLVAAGASTIELAHELIHVSHYNEPGAWNMATRRAPYQWRDVDEPYGREEARTVGLGEYDLERDDGNYSGVTENDLRDIMGFRKRRSYADETLMPETAVGHHYLAVHDARWAWFRGQSDAIAAREAARRPAAAAAAAAAPPAPPRAVPDARERAAQYAEKRKKLMAAAEAKRSAAKGRGSGAPPPPPGGSGGAPPPATGAGAGR